MLKHITFSEVSKPQYSIVILLSPGPYMARDVRQYYGTALEQAGISLDEVVGLHYGMQGSKLSSPEASKHLEAFEKFLDHFPVKYVFAADGMYFKKLTKRRKVEPHQGYALPSPVWPSVKVIPLIGYVEAMYDPRKISKINMAVRALSEDRLGNQPFSEDFIQEADYPTDPESLYRALQGARDVPEISLDIETRSLFYPSCGLLTASVGLSPHKGIAFPLDLSSNPRGMRQVFKNFLFEYGGKTIYHNATFDTKVLIHELWMRAEDDIGGLLEGLDRLHANLEDTKILAYLATNSAGGNELSLKELSRSFAGNYALEDISQWNDMTHEELMEDRNRIMKYNLIDALATQWVYRKYRQEVRDTQEKVYTEVYLPTLKVLTQMELWGMPLDREVVQSTEQELRAIEAHHAQEIAKSPLMPGLTEMLRTQQAEKDTAKLKKKIKTRDDYPDLEFNPHSGQQIAMLLHEYLGLPVTRKTAKGFPSTDGDTLKGHIERLKREVEDEQ